MTETPNETAEAPAAPKKKARRRWGLAVFAVCALLLTLAAAALLAGRYGALSPQGRSIIETRANGLKVGRFGRLYLEGLSGDIWRDFSVRRVVIRDPKGVWIEGRNLRLTWRFTDLLDRRFHATSVSAEHLIVYRRPVSEPKRPSEGMPIDVVIDRAVGRVELMPELARTRGVYDVDASIELMRRNGGQKGTVKAASVLHPGDHLDARFDFGGGRPLILQADAREAQGGALAGALGLAPDQPFLLHVNARGEASTGRFSALAESGASRPVDASGVWGPEGGSAQGRVELAASTHTQALVARLGPQVQFVVTGRKAEQGLFDLEADLTSENVVVTAKGKANLGERRTGPKGVALTASARELSKVTGGPSMGLGRVDGVLTGRLDDLRFVGGADVARVKLGEYGLDRVSGPFELTRKDKVLALEGRLAGAGGRGTGLAAALLGARPTAVIDAARLADGRLMLRKVEATGAGLKVDASGGRSLLGGLNFKGTAAFSNLAAARAGASGALMADWSASQGGAGKPWALSLDAKGERFASGFSELDRLLGTTPSLHARADVAGRKVSITSGALDGAAINATTAGVLDEAGAMRFKLDWSATGPFRAGPVEITGKASGTGAITGRPSAPRADLLADIEAIDLPRLPLKAAKLTLSFMRGSGGSSGVVALTAASEFGPAAARSAFSFPRGGVDLSDLSVDAGGLTASGAVSLRKATPSAADLKVRVVKGAFLDGGALTGAVKIVDAAGGPRATLNLTASDAVLPGSRFAVRSGAVTADGPLSRLPYQARLQGVSASERWRLDGAGTLSAEDPGYELTFGGDGAYGRRNLKTVEPAVLRFGGAERSARLRLAATDGGRIDLDASLKKDAAEIRAQVQQLGLGLINSDLTGRADGTLVLTGQGGRLGGTLEAKLDDARGRGSPREQGLDGVLKAKLSEDTLELDAAVTNEHGLRANAQVVLPAETSASPFRIAIARTRPMRGTFLADGEIKPLWDLLVGGERELAGHVQMQGTLSGTLADPRAVGQAEVDKGRFSDGATGLVLTDVTLRASLADNAVNIVQATGADGHGGSLAGSGRLSLLRNGASTFKLDLKNFRLIDNDLATASASGQATLDRAADGKVRLAGDLTIDRADVAAKLTGSSGVVNMDVIEINKPADVSGSLQPVERRGLAMTLDVTLKAPRRIYLRGKGLDVELSLDAKVGGTTARPSLSGTARVVRGEYDFAGKRFEFDDRGVVYLATSPQAIRLDLSATRDDPSLTAVVRIRGTAAKPEITLTSVPTLPNDEVLSQVLFGRSASQLSPLEAAQLASALSSLAGGGGFDVVGNLRTFAGLDRLSLAGGDESGVTVSGGKYLTDDVYLEITGGGRDGPSAQVEWRLGRNLSILSKLASQGDGKLAVRWRKDY
ncbi:MAG: autotransporter [Phenylobacterium sp.]|uniref:translocation/assembly module TamB domain-containing protein n=1 Tax=Phenylobacterium sp. TaxID=1871053 RepID=UPI0025DFF585|nr:translocation/assembly module TamB domain-containing protein [Phenylobacterium sp.]MBA4011551.1 autotransporter [Phenylobacterium sp.]